MYFVVVVIEAQNTRQFRNGVAGAQGVANTHVRGGCWVLNPATVVQLNPAAVVEILQSEGRCARRNDIGRIVQAVADGEVHFAITALVIVAGGKQGLRDVDQHPLVLFPDIQA